jgi:multidrug efflux system membrane fusion protein
MVLIAGCSGGQAKTQGGPPPAPVTVATAAQKDVPVLVHAIGTVRAFSTVMLRVRIDGRLDTVGFKEGDEVKKGDLLFVLDSRALDAALKQVDGVLAKDIAALQSAEADWQRTKELENTKAMSASAVDQARAKADGLKAQVETDRAAVENAKVLLSYCSIHSPIDGRISTLGVNAGNVVKNNDTVLATINQIKPIYVDFSVPERVLPSVRERSAATKLKVIAAIPENGGQAEGELVVINNQVDTTTGSIMLRAQFPNVDELLWPGQFVNVALELDLRRGAVVVPADAVQDSQQGHIVFVVKADMTAEMRPVVTGPESEGDIVVDKGIAAGELVITRGQLRVVPGAKVKPQP